MPKATDYDKMDPRDHVLKRSDTYIGDIEKTTEMMDVSVLNDTEYKIVSKNTTYVPGLMKCFDELLVNASDAKENDPSCDTIKVYVSKEEGYIKIFNNGDKGIPVEEHPVHKELVPSMIFGQLLTSSNYDDSKKRTTGGRNGYGAKLANIFSTKFEVIVGDSKNEKLFSQTWTENMSKTTKPSVKKYSKKTSYVEITFYPDLTRFGLTTIDDDHFNLFFRRTIDIAGISNNKIKVFFNDIKINVNNFKQYSELYYPEQKQAIVYDDSNERWKVGCMFLPESNNKVISFVNGIATYKGGTHVNHVTDRIIKPLIDDYIKKKDKDIKVTPSLLKDNMVFFINCMIENPAFSSQSKVDLTTKNNKFGSSYEPSDVFMKKIVKSGIVEHMIQYAKFKESTLLKKNDGKKQMTLHGIPKLEDANKAGGKDSNKCSLILTEGDSAKAFAMAGLSLIGRDYYGVFPLKGKLLNVREAPVKQYIGNEEISNLIKIFGFRQDFSYETEAEFNTLRYGRFICLTDQDVDGSHIKGLIMNFIHFKWPALIKRIGFITSFSTPIVKAFKGKKTVTFYNLTEYNTWSETNTGWKIKYYKGLGTSTSAEAKEYFVDMEEKLIKYHWLPSTAIDNIKKTPKKTTKKGKKEEEVVEDVVEDEVEEEEEEEEEEVVEEGDEIEIIPIVVPSVNTDGCDDAITLAFQKNRADNRKDWIRSYNKNEILTYEDRKVSYSQFIHRDMKHFSISDNIRSIPHIMDGLKPSQRKIICGAFSRGLDTDEVKVAQLAGYVSDKVLYHHGEVSLVGTIIGMAQSFIGSNNIELLEPNGQFGTRLMGGKDAAAGRYIWTKLTNKCLQIFNKLDNNILNEVYEDNIMIEPEYYAPIIPMILVNGTQGIGTGFSTDIPSFNPIDIINNLICMMDGNKCKEMRPYWRDFKGTVKKIDKKNFEVTGVYSIKKNKLVITELPVGTWTQSYKEFLEKMYETEMGKNKDDRVFLGFKEFHTDLIVHFELEFIPDYIETVSNITKDFHLTNKVSLNNMNLFSTEGSIKKYESPFEIMTEYYGERLSLYEKRKQYMLDTMKNKIDIISNKARFILMIVEDELVVNRRKKIDIETDLTTHNFPKLSTRSDKLSFDYLLEMSIYELTLEKIEELNKKMEEEQAKYDNLNKMTAIDIWKNELNLLKEKL